MAAMDSVQIHELLAQAEKRLEGNDTAVAAVDNDLDKTQPVAPVAAAVPKTVDGSVRLAQNGHKNNKTVKDSAGSNWFDLPKTILTPEFRRDWQVLRMRGILDPKHQKKALRAEAPKYSQVGQIVEGPADFFSARLARKDRRQTILGEVMREHSDDKLKNKYAGIQKKKTSGKKAFYQKLVAQRRNECAPGEVPICSFAFLRLNAGFGIPAQNRYAQELLAEPRKSWARVSHDSSARELFRPLAGQRQSMHELRPVSRYTTLAMRRHISHKLGLFKPTAQGISRIGLCYRPYSTIDGEKNNLATAPVADAESETPPRNPRSAQAVHLRPLRRHAEHGIPSCDLQLRSFSLQPLEFFSDFALRAAYYLGLPALGPVPLPRITERWTVPRDHFIFKKSQENFERRTLRRMIQIQDGNPETVQLWLAYLRKHQYYGVGMKANFWEFGSTKMESPDGAAVGELNPAWDHLGQTKPITSDEASELLSRGRLRDALGVPRAEPRPVSDA